MFYNSMKWRIWRLFSFFTQIHKNNDNFQMKFIYKYIMPISYIYIYSNICTLYCIYNLRKSSQNLLYIVVLSTIYDPILYVHIKKIFFKNSGRIFWTLFYTLIYSYIFKTLCTCVTIYIYKKNTNPC